MLTEELTMTPEEQQKQVVDGLLRTTIKEATGVLLLVELVKSLKQSRALRLTLLGLAIVMAGFIYFFMSQAQ